MEPVAALVGDAACCLFSEWISTTDASTSNTPGHADTVPVVSRSGVVVGVDASQEAMAALRAALVMATSLDAPLTVVHAVGVLEEGGYREHPPLDALLATARREVGATDTAVNVVTEDGPAPDVVLRVAERVGAAFIAVGRRGIGAAPRPLGSVSEAILARADIPVLVVPVAR